MNENQNPQQNVNIKILVYLGYFIIFGIGVGLAESAKLNGLVVIIAGIGFAIIAAWKIDITKNIKIRLLITSIILLVLFSQITWVILNPFLWSNPILRTEEMFYQRQNALTLQEMAYPGSAMTGIIDRIKIVTKRIFENYAIFNFNYAWLINIPIFLLGFYFVLKTTVTSIRASPFNPASLVILIISISTSIPSLLTPLDWQRYYLYPVFFSYIYIVIGIWKVLDTLINLIKIKFFHMDTISGTL